MLSESTNKDNRMHSANPGSVKENGRHPEPAGNHDFFSEQIFNGPGAGHWSHEDIARMTKLTPAQTHRQLGAMFVNQTHSPGSDIGHRHLEVYRARHRLVQSVLFWLRWLSPFQHGEIRADPVFLQLIKFMAGCHATECTIRQHDGVQLAFEPLGCGRKAILKLHHDGDLITQHLVRVSETALEIREPAEQLIGLIGRMPVGDIQLSDARGRRIQTLAADDLACLRRLETFQTETIGERT